MNFIKKYYKVSLKFTLLLIIVIICNFIFAIQPIFFYPKISHTSLPKQTANKTNLENYVKFLSKTGRTDHSDKVHYRQYILDKLTEFGIKKQQINIQKFGNQRNSFENIIVTIDPTLNSQTSKTYLIGAHYDSFGNLPGADDNASGVAGVLEIARLSQINPSKNKIILAFYDNEEPPYFNTTNMGSYIHAQSLRKSNRIDLVIILEMIGYFSLKPNSQNYPLSIFKTLYSDKGNFITIVSNSKNFLNTRNIKGVFTAFLEQNSGLTCLSINAPLWIPGIDFSDHRSYWKFNIPAIMITDTAFYRNKNYHTKFDTYEKLDYEKMSKIIDALFYYISV